MNETIYEVREAARIDREDAFKEYIEAKRYVGGVACGRALRRVVDTDELYHAADRMLIENGGVIKVCGCGRHYAYGEWERLPLKGRQCIPPNGAADEPWGIELRDCYCGSTICIDVEADGTPSKKSWCD